MKYQGKKFPTLKKEKDITYKDTMSEILFQQGKRNFVFKISFKAYYPGKHSITEFLKKKS